MISNEWKLKEELEESKKENIIEKDKRIEVLESALKKQGVMLNELMKKVSFQVSRMAYLQKGLSFHNNCA